MTDSRSRLGPGAANRVNAVAPLKRFIDVATASITDDVGSFWACEAAFLELTRSTLLEELVQHELAAMLRDSAYFVEESTDMTVMLAKTARFSLTLVFPQPTFGQVVETSPTMPGLACHRIIGVLRGSLKARRYKRPATADKDTLDRTAGLLPAPPVALAEGDAVSFRAGEDVFVSEPPAEPPVLLILESAVVERVLWVYDSETLAPVRAVAGDLVASRLEFAAWLLAESRYTEGLSTLVELARHPTHHVRWTAIRAAARLDARVGKELLERAVNDAHPHVRQAARKALAALAPVAQPAVSHGAPSWR